MSNVNNPDFYPTPDAVIQRMIEPFSSKIKTMQVLEPSAGSGTMLDYITRSYPGVPKKNVYACESDPDRALLLQGKGYRLIESDFLDYAADYSFDLILMNPPFSDGANHLLKAWDVLKSGHIVCLLNQATIDNTCHRNRTLLGKIIEDSGSVQALGPVFMGPDAQRRTTVNVALVRLEKKEPDPRFTFNFIPEEVEADFSEETAGDKLRMNDITGAMLRQYDLTRQAYIQYLQAKKALTFYSAGLIQDRSGDPGVVGLADKCFIEEPTLNGAYNTFVNEFNGSAWRRILTKMNIEKIFTHGVREDLDKFRKAQGSMNLTRDNIYALVDMLLMNRSTIMDRAIVDVFDRFTKYHEENRCHVEGWKTNSSWKVNRKVILPNYLRYVDRYSDYYHVEYSKDSEFSDIDKVMAWLSGDDYDDFRRATQPYDYRTRESDREYKMTTIQQAVTRIRIGDTSLHESQYFLIRCYKKGTMHLTFKDEHLWAIFNQRACKGKNWLPK